MRAINASALMVTLLILAGCGENQQSALARPHAERVSLPLIELAPRQFSQPLIADNGDLLDVKDVIEDGQRLLVLNGRPEELWEMPLAPPHALRRISRPREFGQASVRVMTAHSRGISYLGLDGRLRVMEREAPDVLARTVRAFPPMQRPVALGEWLNGRWVAVHSVLTMSSASSILDSVVVSTLDESDSVSRVYAFERTGPSRPEKLLLDLVSGRVVRGQVVLTANDPARIITVLERAVRIDTLLDAPARPFSAADLEVMNREMRDSRMPPAVRAAPFPAHQFAAVTALPVEGGYLVVAQAGEESFVADLYCGVHFRRTVLSRTSISKIFVVERGLAVVDEPVDAASESPARLSYYRAQDFIAECTK